MADFFVDAPLGRGLKDGSDGDNAASSIYAMLTGWSPVASAGETCWLTGIETITDSQGMFRTDVAIGTDGDTSASPISVIACDSDWNPTRDGYTMSGSPADPPNNMIYHRDGIYWYFYGIKITGSYTGHGIYIVGNETYITLDSLHINGAGINGIELHGNDAPKILIKNCRITNCTGDGINSVITGSVINNYIVGNGGYGLKIFSATPLTHVRGNIIALNGGNGIGCTTTYYSNSDISNNILYKNSENGIDFGTGPSNSNNNLIYDNLICLNGEYGINYGTDTSATVPDGTNRIWHNCMYANVSGASNNKIIEYITNSSEDLNIDMTGHGMIDPDNEDFRIDRNNCEFDFLPRTYDWDADTPINITYANCGPMYENAFRARRVIITS